MPDTARRSAPAQDATIPDDQRGVLVFPSLYVSAGTRGQRMPLLRAFQTQYEGDFLFTCYGGEVRCRKDEAANLRLTALDLDRTPKERWKDFDQARLAHDVVLDRLRRHGLPKAAISYTTPNGIRLVWQLARPVSGKQWSLTTTDLMTRARVALQNLAIDVDSACSDPSRLFRLPRVLRDGRSTSELCDLRIDSSSPPIEPILAAGSTLSELKQAVTSGGHAVAWDDAAVRVWGPEMLQRPAHPIALKALGRLPVTARNVLQQKIKTETTEDFQAAGYVGRNAGIVKLAGQAVKAVIAAGGQDSSVALGLLGKVIHAAESEPGTDWGRLAETKIEQFWSRDFIPVELSEALTAEAEGDTDGFPLELARFKPVLSKIQAWLSTHGADASWSACWDFYEQRCLSVTVSGDVGILWTPDARLTQVRFSSFLVQHVLNPESKHPLARVLAERAIIDEVNGDGEPNSRARRAAEWPLQFAGNTRSLQFEPATSEEFEASLDVSEGLFTPLRPRYVFGEGIVPKFDEVSEAFLVNAFRGQYGEFKKYLRSFGKVERPLPLLILEGRSQQGKSFLASALALLFGPRFARPSVNKPSTFNAERAYSPVISVEESFGKTWSVDTVRTLVNLSQLTEVEAKGKNAIIVEGCSRIIKTTNSLFDDLKTLASTPEGHRAPLDALQAVALRVRSLHVHDKDLTLTDPYTRGAAEGMAAMQAHLLWLAQQPEENDSDHRATFWLPVQDEILTKLLLVPERKNSVRPEIIEVTEETCVQLLERVEEVAEFSLDIKPDKRRIAELQILRPTLCGQVLVVPAPDLTHAVQSANTIHGRTVSQQLVERQLNTHGLIQPQRNQNLWRNSQVGAGLLLFDVGHWKQIGLAGRALDRISPNVEKALRAI